MFNFKQVFAFETIKIFGISDRICYQIGRDGNPDSQVMTGTKIWEKV